MNDADLFHRFALMSSVAAGTATGGVGLLLFAPRTPVGRAAVAAVAVAVTSGLAALLVADSLAPVAGWGVALSALAVLASVSSLRQALGRSVRLIARPRVIGAAGLLVAFAAWGYEAWRFDVGSEANLDATLPGLEASPAPTRVVAHAQTDRGTLIGLAAPTDPLTPDQLAAVSRHSGTITGHANRTIGRGDPSDQSNCHGWVFTGGRFHVGGRLVDAILEDNGYSRVAEPAAGDLCVYRDHAGEVTHTAVVRANLNDGTVLVESKWGRLGVFLHDVDESCYGTDFTYFRTARGGHLLHGLDEGSGVQASEHP